MQFIFHPKGPVVLNTSMTSIESNPADGPNLKQQCLVGLIHCCEGSERNTIFHLLPMFQPHDAKAYRRLQWLSPECIIIGQKGQADPGVHWCVTQQKPRCRTTLVCLLYPDG